MHGKQISNDEIYLLIKYIKSVLWRVAKRLSYIEDTWCLQVDWIYLVQYKTVGPTVVNTVTNL